MFTVTVILARYSNFEIAFLDFSKLKPHSFKNSKSFKRYSKQSQKKNAVSCPENLTEHEWAKFRGFNRIYDCGKKRWCFDMKKED